jgi:urease accessory protein
MACGRRSRTAAWALVLVLAPFEAQAHLANLRFGDFYGGLLHPLTTPAQALALIALALLLGQQGPSRARWALPMLPPALVVGALAPWLLATTHPGCKLVWIDALALMIPALLVVLAVRLPILVPALVAVFIGLVIGRANGMELALLPRDEPLVATGIASPMPPIEASSVGLDADAWLFIAGTTTAGLVSVALIAAAVVDLDGRWSWIAIAVRALGSWIAATGLMLATLSNQL